MNLGEMKRLALVVANDAVERDGRRGLSKRNRRHKYQGGNRSNPGSHATRF
jgi:hypothetical protein